MIADEALANGWLKVAENLRRLCEVITLMAQRRLQ